MVYDGYIKGLTVRLRSIEESDAEITFKMRSDPEKTKYVHRATGTVEDQRNFIIKQRALPGDYLFVVENLDGTPIGMKGVYNLNEEKKEVETGRFICYGSQVQNVEALKLSFDFAFDILGVNKVIMSALENNKVMLGIQKKFGVKFTHAEPLQGFEYNSLFSELSKSDYLNVKDNVESLIKRFACR